MASKLFFKAVLFIFVLALLALCSRTAFASDTTTYRIDTVIYVVDTQYTIKGDYLVSKDTSWYVTDTARYIYLQNAYCRDSSFTPNGYYCPIAPFKFQYSDTANVDRIFITMTQHIKEANGNEWTAITFLLGIRQFQITLDNNATNNLWCYQHFGLKFAYWYIANKYNLIL